MSDVRGMIMDVYTYSVGI